MKELATALAKAQMEFGTVPQSGHNPFHKSKYSTLKDCWDTARPVLGKHGLSVIQMPDAGEDGGMYLMTILMHESGEHLSSRQPVLAAKQDAQSFGSALSYARRYGITAVLGLVSGDEDDDGNAATAVGSKTVKRANPPMSQSPAKTPAPVTPSTSGQGSTKQSLKERVDACEHVGALNALYEEVKGNLKEDDIKLFSERKTELTKG